MTTKKPETRGRKPLAPELKKEATQLYLIPEVKAIFEEIAEGLTAEQARLILEEARKIKGTIEAPEGGAYK